MSHALDHLLGKRMVSSLNIPERRLTEAELRRMPIEDRLIYEMNHPKSDDEKQAELEREDLHHRLGMGDDELTWQDLDRRADSALGED